MGDVRELVLDEDHKSKYSMHLGIDKMYKDLNKESQWPRMKSSINSYIEKCLTCLQIKTGHQ